MPTDLSNWDYRRQTETNVDGEEEEIVTVTKQNKQERAAVTRRCHKSMQAIATTPASAPQQTLPVF